MRHDHSGDSPSPDAISAVLLPHLLGALERQAPGIDIGLVQLLPQHRGRLTSQVWHQTLTELESRTLDFAILPIGEVPPRFVSHKLFDQTFVVTMRKGHSFASVLIAKFVSSCGKVGTNFAI